MRRRVREASGEGVVGFRRYLLLDCRMDEESKAARSASSGTSSVGSKAMAVMVRTQGRWEFGGQHGDEIVDSPG